MVWIVKTRRADAPPLAKTISEDVPMFADSVLGIDTSHAVRLALNCLYVLGGFIAGYVAMVLASAGYEHWVSGHPTPKFVNKMLRLLGGVIVATLVALFVFNSGSGNGGSGNGETSATGKGNAPATQPDAPPTPAVKPPPTHPAVDTIHITVLGGFIADGAYYRLDDAGGRAVGVNEAMAYVKQRKDAATVAPVVAVTLDPVNKTERRNPVVVQLTDRVKAELRLAVTFPAEGP